jgi:hypothetical protein
MLLKFHTLWNCPPPHTHTVYVCVDIQLKCHSNNTVYSLTSSDSLIMLYSISSNLWTPQVLSQQTIVLPPEPDQHETPPLYTLPWCVISCCVINMLFSVKIKLFYNKIKLSICGLIEWKIFHNMLHLTDRTDRVKLLLHIPWTHMDSGGVSPFTL